jgi:hypothetical protein
MAFVVAICMWCMQASMLNKLRSKFPAEGYDPAHVHASSFNTTALSEAGYELMARCLVAHPKKRCSDGKDALDAKYFQAGTGPTLQRLDEAQLKRAKEEYTAGRSYEAILTPPALLKCCSFLLLCLLMLYTTLHRTREGSSSDQESQIRARCGKGSQ